MEQRLAALYNKLAGHIISMIPVKWSEFHYLGEVTQGKQSYTSVFYFRSTDGRFIRSNDMPKIYGIPKSSYLAEWLKLNGILLEIYDCFADYGQELWEQLSFSVESSGKFKVDYRYDVKDGKDGGPFVRELLWARETFGYTPKEGSAGSKVLERWLNEH